MGDNSMEERVEGDTAKVESSPSVYWDDYRAKKWVLKLLFCKLKQFLLTSHVVRLEA